MWFMTHRVSNLNFLSDNWKTPSNSEYFSPTWFIWLENKTECDLRLGFFELIEEFNHSNAGRFP